MEKDVLLELVATGLAEIFRAKQRGDTTEELSNNDRHCLVNMQNRLYSSNENEWDFLKTANEIKGIYEKYELRN